MPEPYLEPATRLQLDAVDYLGFKCGGEIEIRTMSTSQLSDKSCEFLRRRYRRLFWLLVLLAATIIMALVGRSNFARTYGLAKVKLQRISAYFENKLRRKRTKSKNSAAKKRTR